jgi:hypothetical protein
LSPARGSVNCWIMTWFHKSWWAPFLLVGYVVSSSHVLSPVRMLFLGRRMLHGEDLFDFALQWSILNREARWPLSMYIEASNLFIWAELGSSSILSEKCGECCSFVCARNWERAWQQLRARREKRGERETWQHLVVSKFNYS